MIRIIRCRDSFHLEYFTIGLELWAWWLPHQPWLYSDKTKREHSTHLHKYAPTRLPASRFPILTSPQFFYSISLIMTPPSEQNARLRPFTCFNWKSFLLDELIIIHPPLSVLLYQLDIEAQDQLLDELVQFHEGYVLAQTRARAAATALVSFESFVKKFVNHMRILSSSTQQIRICKRLFSQMYLMSALS